MNDSDARQRPFDILTELLNLARQRGYARVSLETGSTPRFDAAVAMYRRFGFVDCWPFCGLPGGSVQSVYGYVGRDMKTSGLPKRQPTLAKGARTTP
ncbi:hypothetical protein [Hydrogenophaga sp.]|uniref:hypothetical protein n=1 Tax=Hydrogenophaga sp. TaxID=1904254 RepID=UPI003F6B9F3D